MDVLTLKALHIVAVVCWFAGLFYIVRLFVYLRETMDRPAAERAVLDPQLQLMATRLWLGITWPSGVATVVLGLALLGTQYGLGPYPGWMHLKLALVAGLCAYHAGCHVIYHRLIRGVPVWSGRGFRIYNELATLFLVSIVFLVVLKSALSVVWGVLGLIGFAAVLMLGINVYRRVRQPTV
ncbi:MAG: CopD family protein [Myxococcota bacterium]